MACFNICAEYNSMYHLSFRNVFFSFRSFPIMILIIAMAIKCHCVNKFIAEIIITITGS